MRTTAGVVLLLLALVACGSAPTQVAATDKAVAKRQAAQQVAEAEAFALDAQRQIDAAEAAVAEAERIVKEQQAEAAARQAAAARASRSRTTAPRRATPAPRAAGGGDIFDALARCESGGDPRKNTGNGFYGAFQFMLSTWRSLGMSGNPIDHSYSTQKAAAERLVARSGWGQFPHCSRKIGAR